MENSQMQQQLASLKNDVDSLKRQSARDRLVREYIEKKYRGYQTPQQYAVELTEMLRARYTQNLSIWKDIIYATGSAYDKAYRNFQKYKNIHQEEKMARDQMVANILSIFTGAGLCWIAPAVRKLKHFNHALQTEGAKVFFSNGIQEIVKQTGKKLASNMPAISFDMEAPNSVTMLASPLKFQNDLLRTFERFKGIIVAELNTLIENLNSDGSSSDRVQRFGDHNQYDINDFSISDDQLKKKIASVYNAAKDLVKNMNEVYIKDSCYFRKKPAFNADNNYETDMAVRFERAMWAGWIPGNLRRIDSEPLPASRIMTAASPPFPRDCYSPAALQKLKPGYYSVNSDCVMRVYEKHEKPGSTLENHLEALHVIKPKKVNPKNMPPQDVRQLENFGWVTSESEIKKLIAWAGQEHHHQYASDKYNYTRRDRSELIIRPLA